MSRKFITIYILFGLLTLNWINPKNAQAISITLLTASQATDLMELLAGATVFRSLEAPSNPHKPFGFWFNVRANASYSSTIYSLFGVSGTPLPFANAQFGFNGPFGLGLEFGGIPSQTYSSITFSNYGMDVKWSFLKAFVSAIPIDAALRVLYTTSSISGDMSVSAASATASYSSSVFGASVDASKNFNFFEPYLGVGILSQSSSLAYSGGVSIFSSEVPLANDSLSSATSSFWFKVGFELRFVATLGFQYDWAYNANTLSTKFGFRF